MVGYLSFRRLRKAIGLCIVFSTAAGVSAVTAGAQQYDTPADYRSVEAAVTSRLATCFANPGSYEHDLQCASSLMDYCIDLSPDGHTTAGLSICGGVVSNVLDRGMNDAWASILRDIPAGAFEDLRGRQRDWLRLRAREMRAAIDRYDGGSMSAYSGWIRYNDLSARRLARLREIASRP